MTRVPQSNLAATRWAIRIVPVCLAGIFGFATYVVPAHLCINYLYRQEHESGSAAALLTLYFLFALLTFGTYIRIFVTIQRHPAVVPLPPGREDSDKDNEKPKRRRGTRGRDIEAQPWAPPDENPDSPGLEAFYSKRVFVCESDGRPKWCSECRQWKPDRANHSSEMGRCVRKMDHLCPWVGGMVCETSFNFFIQFVVWCTFYCAICLVASAYCLSKQRQQGQSVDGRVIAIIALSGFFIIFTSGMAITSLRFAFLNTTNIDMLKKSKVVYLAIRIPRGSPSTVDYPIISYPLSSNPWWPGNSAPNEQVGTGGNAVSRDGQAIHTFAIVRTNPNESIWDLGWWRNFKSVMGNNIVEWLLPISYSPCCNHDRMDSDYELGPLLTELKKRHKIPEDTGGERVEEMREFTATGN